jgi:hypothetical protein
MKRRTFLSVGLGGAALLAAGGWWWSTQHSAPTRAALNTPDADALLTALIPAVIGKPEQRLGAKEVTAAVARAKGAIAALPLIVQDEIGELFGLLSNGAAWPPEFPRRGRRPSPKSWPRFCKAGAHIHWACCKWVTTRCMI